MVFIGICGASGSGKTTLAKELCRAIGASSALLNQDAYYLDHPELTFEERTKLNYDEPFIFDHDLLYQDARMLMAGQSVTLNFNGDVNGDNETNLKDVVAITRKVLG